MTVVFEGRDDPSQPLDFVPERLGVGLEDRVLALQPRPVRVPLVGAVHLVGT